MDTLLYRMKNRQIDRHADRQIETESGTDRQKDREGVSKDRDTITRSMDTSAKKAGFGKITVGLDLYFVSNSITIKHSKTRILLQYVTVWMCYGLLSTRGMIQRSKRRKKKK